MKWWSWGCNQFSETLQQSGGSWLWKHCHLYYR